MSIINYEDDMLPGVTCRLYGFGIPLQVNIHNTYWRFGGGGQLDAGESENIACLLWSLQVVLLSWTNI